MAYSTDTPASLVFQPPGAGPRIWAQSSADVTGDVDAAGFITNAGALGMKVGDLVIHYDTTTAAAVVVSTHVVNTVSSTYPGAANLSVGTSIGAGGTSGD